MWSRASIVFGKLLVVATAVGAIEAPVGVSPGVPTGPATPAVGCPTFSWSSVDGATDYELVVYSAAPNGVGGELASPVLRHAIGARALSWSVPSDACLDGSATYAWSVRAHGTGVDSDWSQALLFGVSATPTRAEVTRALEVLERYVDSGGELGDPLPGPRADDATTRRDVETLPERGKRGVLEAVDPMRSNSLGPEPGGGQPLPPPDYALSIDKDLGLGGYIFQNGKHLLHTAGGTFDENTAVGLYALSNLVPSFVGVEGSENTALGFAALEALEFGDDNTAVGAEALRNATGDDNTGIGSRALVGLTSGFGNTAVGSLALANNTEGHSNTAVGKWALIATTTGVSNVAVGTYSLRKNKTGHSNIAVGNKALNDLELGVENVAIGHKSMRSSYKADYNVAVGPRAHQNAFDANWNVAIGTRALYNGALANTNVALGGYALRATRAGGGNIAVGFEAGSMNIDGSNNVFIDHEGFPGDGATPQNSVIRLGSDQDLTFIAGIRGTTTSVPDAVAVMIDSAGQLGTISSSRAKKRDIREVGDLSRRLLALEPVAFRYRQNVQGKLEAPLEFGLVAEEVAEVFPELVVLDASGRPETVKYHLLSSLLLNELQRQQRTVQAHTVVLAFGLVVALALALGFWRARRPELFVAGVGR